MSGARPDVVRAAQGWLGTPYRHQASRRGAGCDCLGLIRGVWREVIGPEPEVPPPYSLDWSEPQGEERLWAAALRNLAPAAGADVWPGQVILFRMRGGAVAKHLGIVSVAGAAPRFLHAYSGHGVVDTALSRPWRRRVVARFDFPEGAL